MKLNNYYTELPDNFKEAYVIDAKDKKTSILFTVFSFVIMAIVFVLTYFITKLFKTFDFNFYSFELLIADAVFIISMFAYIILHELTHGIVYKIMTKQKWL